MMYCISNMSLATHINSLFNYINMPIVCDKNDKIDLDSTQIITRTVIRKYTVLCFMI